MAQLLGVPDATHGTPASAPNYLVGSRFQASGSGDITTIELYQEDGGANANVGIYSDNAGQPNALLKQSTAKALATGWNEYTIDAVSVTSGSYYWLAAVGDGNNTEGCHRVDGSGDLGWYQLLSAGLVLPATATYTAFDTTIPMQGSSAAVAASVKDPIGIGIIPPSR